MCIFEKYFPLQPCRPKNHFPQQLQHHPQSLFDPPVRPCTNTKQKPTLAAKCKVRKTERERKREKHQTGPTRCGSFPPYAPTEGKGRLQLWLERIGKRPKRSPTAGPVIYSKRRTRGTRLPGAAGDQGKKKNKSNRNTPWAPKVALQGREDSIHFIDRLVAYGDGDQVERRRPADPGHGTLNDRLGEPHG